jgi:DNA polymerase III gamma/tau subunit
MAIRTRSRIKKTTHRTGPRAAPKKSPARTPASVGGRLRKEAALAGERIKGAWEETRETVTAAQGSLETQIKALLKKNKISTKDAASAFKDVRARAERERKKAARELRARLAELQLRMQKERRALARTVDEAVHSALAAFNIPSRQEVANLTRKVEELSRKIDRLRR